MNKFVVKHMVNTMINNIEKYVDTKTCFDETNHRYYIYSSFIFEGINFPSKELKEETIKEFNSVNGFGGKIDNVFINLHCQTVCIFE